MRFRDFASVFADRPCFTARDVALRFPGFHDRQLYYWQTKGLVRQLRKPHYRLSGRPWTLHERRAVANMLYAPSYVSLESALAHHGFIPEGVFHITSITTRHTRTFEVEGVRHFYRNVKPGWFFGYTIIEHEGIAMRMAGPEKALLDLLHLDPQHRAPDDFEALRLDRPGIREAIDPGVWNDHLALSTNKALHTRARAFQRWLHDRAR